jgi:hypothetical protein
VALACLVVAGVGATVMATADGLKLAAAVTRADEASTAETTPATSLAPLLAHSERRMIAGGVDSRFAFSVLIAWEAGHLPPQVRVFILEVANNQVIEAAF